MKLTPTNRTDYGIRALIYLANHQGSHAKAADIGSAMGIPTGFLQQVLQELQPRPPGQLAVGPPRVATCSPVPPRTSPSSRSSRPLRGPIGTSECALRGGPCHWDDVCAMHWVWSSAWTALSDSLRAATLARVAADDRALAEGRAEVPADSHRRRPG